MRWLLTLLVLATVASFALVAGGDPGGPAAPSCTWTGTNVRNIKTGTPGRDILCALPGNDYVHGAGGNDVIRAGAGRDTVVGGGGRDVVRGGAGPDRLFAVDDRGGETVYGGPGIDQCFVDPGDRAVGCDRTFRSNEPEMATALGQSLRVVMEIAEVLPTTPAPVVVTVTETLDCGGHPAPPPIC